MILTATPTDALYSGANSVSESYEHLVKGCEHLVKCCGHLLKGRVSLLRTEKHAELNPSSLHFVCFIVAAVAVLLDACVEYCRYCLGYRRAPWILKLPDDLLLEIFAHLDFPDGFDPTHTACRAMATSQVCRQWRAAALADRTLWTDIRLTEWFVVGHDYHHPRRRNVSRLCRILIPRSHPASFRITLDVVGSLSSKACALIRDNLWRLEAYSGPDAIAAKIGLDRCSLPSTLTSIEIRGFVLERCFYIPNSWGQAGSVVSSISVGQFAFASPAAPFAALRHFKGALTASGPEALRLFRICPRLETLHLSNVFETSCLPLPPIPPSLRHVTLVMTSPDNRGPQDPSTILSLWMGHPIDHLDIDGVSNMAAVVRLFTLAHPGGLSAFVGDNLILAGLAEDSDDIRYTVGPRHGFGSTFYNSFPGLTVHTDCIERLTITWSQLTVLRDSESRGSFPALRSLQIVIRRYDDGRIGDRHYSALEAPSLKTLDLAWVTPHVPVKKDSIYQICDRLPANLRRIISFEARVLQRVTLTLAGHSQGLREADTRALAALAREFVLIRRPDLPHNAFDDLTKLPADPRTLITEF